MNSNNSNVVYLQNALRNLEDRYKKLQNRSESLQVQIFYTFNFQLTNLYMEIE